MLRFAGVSKRFGGVNALADCSFAVERGRLVGFLGPNGAGKTTSMRAIFGLVELDRGEVTWDGHAIGLADRLRFGYMPEERGLYPRMRVADQLVYFGRQHGLSRAAAGAATSEWLERLGIADRAGARVEELSHGNQQRVQLAAALVHAPDLLVLDEPFAGLDPVAVATLVEVLSAEAHRGAAVLFSSHQLELVEDICQDVTIIDHGRIAASGNLDALRRGSRRRRIDLRLADAPQGWAPNVPGVELVDRHNGDVRLAVGRDVDPAQVLAAADRIAEVIEFSYGPPSLAELFVELVQR